MASPSAPAASQSSDVEDTSDSVSRYLARSVAETTAWDIDILYQRDILSDLTPEQKGSVRAILEAVVRRSQKLDVEPSHVAQQIHEMLFSEDCDLDFLWDLAIMYRRHRSRACPECSNPMDSALYADAMAGEDSCPSCGWSKGGEA
ncbi:hypothetical protein VNI00_018156 [Paramarasmius palmivorus]|uniref:Uncharacterized protein n=1 Tax=Paramarasmius palmivorus TaxID=297713 RepID=A0AAW0B3T7_9AGAR